MASVIRTCCGIFGAMALMLSASADNQLPADLKRFEWRSTLSGSFETGQVYRARLTPEVFDGFQSFPLDLRLIDRHGSNWPSLVWSRTDRSSIIPIRHAALTHSATTSNAEFSVREFQIEPEPDGSIPVHNRVIVHNGSKEQVRRAEVWGGPNEDKLVMLGSGFLIEQKLPAPVRNRAIDYPDSRLPTVVVRVFQDMREPAMDLDWRSTEIARVERDDSDHEMIILKRLDAPTTEPPVEGVDAYYLDSGARNRPLMYLMFTSDATDFAIPIRVMGRNSETNKWRWIADGGIHHLDGHEQNRVTLAKADYRYLKVEFYHYAQKPPKIKHIMAAAMPHFLVFEAKSDAKPHLFFGAPRYDLDMSNPLRRVDPAGISEDQEATFSKRHVNPMQVAGSLSDYRNLLMRFGLGIIVLLVGIFTVRLIRRRYF